MIIEKLEMLEKIQRLVRCSEKFGWDAETLTSQLGLLMMHLEQEVEKEEKELIAELTK